MRRKPSQERRGILIPVGGANVLQPLSERRVPFLELIEELCLLIPFRSLTESRAQDKIGESKR